MGGSKMTADRLAVSKTQHQNDGYVSSLGLKLWFAASPANTNLVGISSRLVVGIASFINELSMHCSFVYKQVVNIAGRLPHIASFRTGTIPVRGIKASGLKSRTSHQAYIVGGALL